MWGFVLCLGAVGKSEPELSSFIFFFFFFGGGGGAPKSRTVIITCLDEME